MNDKGLDFLYDFLKGDKVDFLSLIEEMINGEKEDSALYLLKKAEKDELPIHYNFYYAGMSLKENVDTSVIFSFAESSLEKEDLSSFELFDLAGLFFEFEDYDRAIEIFLRSLSELKEEENNFFKIRIYYNIGLCYCYSDNYQQAIDNFNSVLEINPFFIDCLINTALCYVYSGDPEKGREYVFRAESCAVSKQDKAKIKKYINSQLFLEGSVVPSSLTDCFIERFL